MGNPLSSGVRLTLTEMDSDSETHPLLSVTSTRTTSKLEGFK